MINFKQENTRVRTLKHTCQTHEWNTKLIILPVK